MICTNEVENIIMVVFPEIKKKKVIRKLWISNKTTIWFYISAFLGRLSLEGSQNSALKKNAVCIVCI